MSATEEIISGLSLNDYSKQRFRESLRQISDHEIIKVDLSCSSSMEKARKCGAPLPQEPCTTTAPGYGEKEIDQAREAYLIEMQNYIKQQKEIYDVMLGTPAMSLLADALKYNSKVTCIKLHECNITDETLSILIEALKSMENIKAIDLEVGNFISVAGGRQLLELLENKPSIQVLKIDRTLLTKQTLEGIERQLSLNSETTSTATENLGLANTEENIFARSCTFFDNTSQDGYCTTTVDAKQNGAGLTWSTPPGS